MNKIFVFFFGAKLSILQLEEFRYVKFSRLKRMDNFFLRCEYYPWRELEFYNWRRLKLSGLSVHSTACHLELMALYLVMIGALNTFSSLILNIINFGRKGAIVSLVCICFVFLFFVVTLFFKLHDLVLTLKFELLLSCSNYWIWMYRSKFM